MDETIDIINQPVRTCKICGLTKPETQFFRKLSKNQKVYRYRTCNKCYHQKNVKRINENHKRHRATGGRHAFYVKNNAKQSDIKYHREYDLDINFVKDMISHPCTYCGRVSKLMSIDRVDSKIGHLKTNVVPCCRRCNFIKNSMPYEAWIIIAKAVKEVTEAGLFGDWYGTRMTHDRKDDE